MVKTHPIKNAFIENEGKGKPDTCMHQLYFDAKRVAQLSANILGTTASEDFQKEFAKNISPSGAVANRFAETVKRVCQAKIEGKTDNEQAKRFKKRAKRLREVQLDAKFEEMCGKLLTPK